MIALRGCFAVLVLTVLMVLCMAFPLLLIVVVPMICVGVYEIAFKKPDPTLSELGEWAGKELRVSKRAQQIASAAGRWENPNADDYARARKELEPPPLPRKRGFRLW
jgi:hypothetical protein